MSAAVFWIAALLAVVTPSTQGHWFFMVIAGIAGAWWLAHHEQRERN